MADDKKPTATPKTPPKEADVDSLLWIGHGLSAALGVLAVIAGFGVVFSEIQKTLAVVLFLAGALLPFLAWLSFKGSRAAWSFLIAMCIVLAVMTLFGAPKVRNLVGIPLGVATLVPVLFGVATFCLSMLDHRYKK